VVVQAMQDIVMPTDRFANMRLFQLISPSLPTGSFTYSQGIEWAVECGWVNSRDSLVAWLNSLLISSFEELEIPLLKRLYLSGASQDIKRFTYWASYAVACRETKELRQEEINRGRAMTRLIEQLGLELESEWLDVVRRCQIAAFALTAVRWNIDLQQAVLGYTWGWLENMVMAAVKIVPLGQSAGQIALMELIETATEIVKRGLLIEDDNIGGSCPAFTIASCLHETQYTRLFRS